MMFNFVHYCSLVCNMAAVVISIQSTLILYHAFYKHSLVCLVSSNILGNLRQFQWCYLDYYHSGFCSVIQNTNGFGVATIQGQQWDSNRFYMDSIRIPIPFSSVSPWVSRKKKPSPRNLLCLDCQLCLACPLAEWWNGGTGETASFGCHSLLQCLRTSA